MQRVVEHLDRLLKANAVLALIGNVLGSSHSNRMFATLRLYSSASVYRVVDLSEASISRRRIAFIRDW
jgi:hypothetical protein